MSNPAPAKGGMPRWLIIILVILLIVVIGCCGGFVTCTYVVGRAGNAATSFHAEEIRIKEEKQAEIEAQIAKAQKRIEEAAKNAATQNGMPAGGAVIGPAITGSDSGGGITPERATGQELGTGRMPANFPADIPLMPGLSPTGATAADKIKGSGAGVFTGRVKKEDAAAFYEKQMVEQGWKIETNQDFADSTIIVFTKDKRRATFSLSPDSNKTSTIATIAYETTQ